MYNRLLLVPELFNKPIFGKLQDSNWWLMFLDLHLDLKDTNTLNSPTTEDGGCINLKSTIIEYLGIDDNGVEPKKLDVQFI